MNLILSSRLSHSGITWMTCSWVVQNHILNIWFATFLTHRYSVWSRFLGSTAQTSLYVPRDHFQVSVFSQFLARLWPQEMNIVFIYYKIGSKIMTRFSMCFRNSSQLLLYSLSEISQASNFRAYSFIVLSALLFSTLKSAVLSIHMLFVARDISSLISEREDREILSWLKLVESFTTYNIHQFANAVSSGKMKMVRHSTRNIKPIRLNFEGVKIFSIHTMKGD